MQLLWDVITFALHRLWSLDYKSQADWLFCLTLEILVSSGWVLDIPHKVIESFESDPLLFVWIIFHPGSSTIQLSTIPTYYQAYKYSVWVVLSPPTKYRPSYQVIVTASGIKFWWVNPVVISYHWVASKYLFWSKIGKVLLLQTKCLPIYYIYSRCNRLETFRAYRSIRNHFKSHWTVLSPPP